MIKSLVARLKDIFYSAHQLDGSAGNFILLGWFYYLSFLLSYLLVFFFINLLSEKKIVFHIAMFIFTKISFCFLVLSETFSNNSELLSIIDNISLKLQGKLTHISKYLKNKKRIIKTISQKAPRGSYKCFY